MPAPPLLKRADSRRVSQGHLQGRSFAGVSFCSEVIVEDTRGASAVRPPARPARRAEQSSPSHRPADRKARR